MPIIGFSTDYSGRTRDINVLKVNSYTDGQTQTDTVAFGPISQYVAGIEKLVQRYAILFLTKVGSEINYPDFGTDFLLKLQNSSNILSVLDVQHLFNFANLDVLGIMKTYQANTPGLPLDEQLGSAQMIKFSSNGDTLFLSIQITSLAGNYVIFLLPIPLNN